MALKSNNISAAFHDFFSRSGKDAVSPVPPPLPPFSATGGSAGSGNGLQPGDGYTYWVFTNDGPNTFTVSEGTADAEYIAVAGGGGGSEGRQVDKFSLCGAGT